MAERDRQDSLETPPIVPEASTSPVPNRLLRPFYAVLGCVMVALGIIGAFLPLMPTTIFLILAAWCFARSSPRLERWLLDHRQFGPPLRNWRDHGAISKGSKIMACIGMIFGFVVFYLSVQPRWEYALLVGLVLALCASFVLSRPAPER